MAACDYVSGNVDVNEIFDACVASFKFEDTELAQDDILWMLENIGSPCEGAEEEEEETTPAEYPGAEIAVLDRVIDSDTVAAFICPDGECTLAPLESNRFRLWHVSGDSEEYPSGAEAKAWMQEQLKEGDIISFDRKGLDPYDRILAIVYAADGTNINTELIAVGYGRPWTAEESMEYETEVSPTGPVLQFTGNVTVPDNIELGSQNWIGAEYLNIGDQSGVYWLGVRLIDINGTEWLYNGNSQYATAVAAGETKTLWCSFTPPTTLQGDLRTFVILNMED